MQVEIKYNPYKMETEMRVDSIDVCSDEKNYGDFKRLIKCGTPLQTWIEPIEYRHWGGFVNELTHMGQNDEITVEFSGRQIDFEDLKHSIESQNAKRPEPDRVRYTFKHVKKLDDNVLAQNIEEVVSVLEGDRFRKLVQSRPQETALQARYAELDKNYKQAKKTEFDIVFAGVYSSGKSTILNVLMRHNVLPTDEGTCTSRNCSICHNAALNKKISLKAFVKNSEDPIVSQVFENDEDCAALFQQIFPPQKKTPLILQYAAVERVELEADLSHLYPDSVSADKFRIVLIDTPGMDSAQSSYNGENAHRKIALEAIGMETKPMVILCVDAQKVEDVSIGGFMKEIARQVQKDNGGFNDRFLFLMNKCDASKYNCPDTLQEKIDAFSKYLTNASQWGEQNTEQTTKAAQFIPRVFPVSALTVWAIQKKAEQFSKEELKDQNKRAIKNILREFKENVCEYNDENFYLSDHCSVPADQIDNLKKAFQQRLDEKDLTGAAELQCGIVCVESAIRDYIARYAYPIKVRALLDTFEDVLDDVDSFAEASLRRLREMQKTMGEKSNERKEVQEEKSDIERKRGILEEAKRKVEDKQKQLALIQFDGIGLKKAILNFEVEMEENPSVKYFRKNETVWTGQKSYDEILIEVGERMRDINNAFTASLHKTNGVLNNLQRQYICQLQGIYGSLTDTVRLLRQSGAFQLYSYDFTKTVEWRTNFNGLDMNKFTNEAMHSARGGFSVRDSRPNRKKEEWAGSLNPFKKLGALFMSADESYERWVCGSYKTEATVKALDDYYNELDAETDALTKSAQKMLGDSKEHVRDLTNQLFNALEKFIGEIDAREQELRNLTADLAQLKEKEQEEEKNVRWMKDLKKRLQEV